MEKIKLFLNSDKGKDVLVIIIIILVGLGSFMLGRLSTKGKSEGIKIQYSGNQAGNVISSVRPIDTQVGSKGAKKGFFASNRGTKYYPIGCPAGDNLKVENRIYFNTSREAEDAGYELSSSCNR